MSTTIDERVVEMRFDNQQFEKNVQTSMGTLEKLKERLNFKGASKGLENIRDAAKNVNMSSLIGAVDAVHVKFSALDAMSHRVFSNIADDIMRTGKKIISEFTIDPVRTGFSEFELKMGSVQTIMASTGESLETVNQYLDELNTYSDKTIYSFSDMTQNIGKFTNAGVKLDDAVMAIKGISNEAALSGANANEASRAMYNFAQALSAGYVKLIDWKSIENANMATVSFKEQLLEAAVAAGTVEKTADGMYKVLSTNAKGDKMDGVISATQNFNDSLSYQWMTTDVLVNTLKDYADETTDIGKKAYAAAQDVKTFSMMMDTLKEAAQSGWAQTWELIIGDFEEGKTLWTSLSEMFGNVISASADARNQYLGDALNSSWEKITEKVSAAGIPIEDFQNKVKDLAKEHGIAIDKMIEDEGSLAAVMASGKVSGDIVTEAISKLADAALGSADAAGEAGEDWKGFAEIVARYVRGDFTDNPEQYIKAITDAGYDFNKVQEVTNQLYKEMGYNWGTYEEVLDAASKAVGDNAEALVSLSDEELKNKGYTEDQIKALRALKEEAERTGTPLNELINNLEKPSGRSLLIDSIMNSLKALGRVFTSIKQAWKGVFGQADSGKLYDLIDGFHTLTSGLLDTVTANIGNLTLAFKGVFSVVDLVASIVSGALSYAFNGIKNIFKSLNIDVFAIAGSLGKAVSAWANWAKTNNVLAKALGSVWDAGKGAVSTISSWITQLKSIPEVSKWIQDLEGKFNDFGNFLRTTFPNAAKFIDDFVTGFKNMAGIDENWDGKFNITNFVKNFVEYISDVQARVADLKKFFGDAKSSIVSFFDSFLGKTDEMGEAGENIDGATSGISKFVTDVKTRVGELRDFLISVKDTIFSFFSGIGEQVNTFFSEGGIKGGVSSFFGNLFGGEGGTSKNPLSFLDKLFTKTVTSESNVMSGGSSQQSGVGTILKEGEELANSNLGKKISDSLKLDDSVMQQFGIKGILDQVGESLGDFIDNVKSLFDGFSIDKLISVCFSAATLLNLKNIAKAIGGFADVSKSASGVLDSVKKTIDTVPDLAKGFTDNLKPIFESVSGTIDAFTKVLKKSARAIKKVIKNFALIEKGFANVLKGLAFEKKTEGIKNIAESLLMLVAAVTVLTLLDQSKMWSAVTAVTVLAGVLAALALVTKSISKSSVDIGRDGIQAQRASNGIMQIATSLLLMLAVMKIAGTLKKEEIVNGTAFIAAFIIFSKLATKAMSIDDNKKTASGSLLKLTVAIALMAGVVKIVSKLKVSEVAKASLFIAAFIVFLKKVVEVTTISGEDQIAKVSSVLKSLSIAIGILAAVAAILGLIPIENLAKGVVAVSALGLLIIAMLKACKGVNSVKGNLIAMTAVVVVLAGLLSVLSMIDSSSLVGPTLALSALMVMFALITKVADGANISVKSMAVIIVAVGVLAGILYAMSALNVGSTLEIAASISLVMLAFAASLNIINDVSSISWKTVGAMAVLALIAAGIGLVLVELSKLNPEPTLGIAAAISLVMLGLSKAAEILGEIGEISLKGVAGAAALLALVVAVSAILAALAGAVAQKDGAQEFLDSGIPIMESIGKAIGAFIGGIGEGVTGSLPQMGEDIASFVNNLAAASGSFDAVKQLADAMSSAAWGSVKVSFSDMLTGLFGNKTSMEKFKEDGVAFFGAMKEVIAASEGVTIDETAFSAIVTAGQELSKLQSSIEPIGGIAQTLAGTKDLGTFGEDAATFLSQMRVALDAKNYENFNYDEASFETITTAAEDLEALRSSISPIGGLVTVLKGNDDLKTFGENAAAFLGQMKIALDADNYKDFKYARTPFIIITRAATDLATLRSSITPIGGLASVLKGNTSLTSFGGDVALFLAQMKLALDTDNFSEFDYDKDSLGNIVSAATELSALESSLTPMESVLDFFTGENKQDLGDFGEHASDFITQMAEAFSSDNFSDFSYNETAIDNLISAATELSGLEASLSPMGGVITWFTEGTQDLGKFGERAGDFITAMATAFSGVGDVTISETSLDSMITAAGKLSELEDTLTGENDIVAWFTGRTDLGDFGTSVTDFATGIGALSTALGEKGLSETAIQSAIDATGKLQELQETLGGENGIIKWWTGKTDLSEFGTRITDFANGLGALKTNLGETGIPEALIQSIGTAVSDLKAIGEDLPSDDVMEGLTDFAESVGELLATTVDKFSENVGTIDDSKSKAAIAVANQITLVVSALQNINGTGLDKFTGEGGYVETIANSLVSYSNIIKDVDVEKSAEAVKVANNIRRFVESLADFDSGGITQFAAAMESVDFSTAIDALITGFADAINDAKKDKVSEAIKNLIPTGDALDKSNGKKAGKALAKAVVNAFKNFITKSASESGDAVTAAKSLADVIPTALDNSSDDVTTSATTIMNAFISAVNTGLSNAKTAISTALSAMTSTINGYYGLFYHAGYYLVMGFADGIDKTTWFAKQKAAAMAKAAADEVNRVLHVGSPSKVFYKIGTFAGLGFVNALNDKIKSAREAGASLAGSAKEGLKQSVSKMSSVIDGEIDVTPTIRPILDLSDVQRGARRINGMITPRRSIELAGNLSAGTMTIRGIQNGGSEEIVSAIGKLQDVLGSQGGDTYNVNGITYDDGSNVSDAVRTLIRAARVGRRT